MAVRNNVVRRGSRARKPRLEDAARVAAKLKVLADPTRLQLLNLVAAQGERPLCVKEMEALLDVGQPTVSHHLKRLTEVGLLRRKKVGRRAYFAVELRELDKLSRFLQLRHE